MKASSTLWRAAFPVPDYPGGSVVQTNDDLQSRGVESRLPWWISNQDGSLTMHGVSSAGLGNPF
jgi:hypothetical protein